MGLADLHIHTLYSGDSLATVAAVLKTAVARGLNVIAITDHDELTGAREAQALAPEYGLDVVPGVEVSTRDGHVLALYVGQPIRAGGSLRDTVLRIGEAGGLAIVAHPGAFGVDSLSPYLIRQVRREPDVARVLVGLETLNGSLIYQRRNSVVAAVGSSDAHSLAAIGSGVTRFMGHSAADLRRQLESASTQAFSVPPAGVSSGPSGDWLPKHLWRCVRPPAAYPAFDSSVCLACQANRLSEAR